MDRPDKALHAQSAGRAAFHSSKPSSTQDILLYFIAVLLAVGLLFAITAVPGNSATLFPNVSVYDATISCWLKE